jgi:two-component system LytT family sensor kinase
MKKYFLFIAGLIILLFNSRSMAQPTSSKQAEIKRFMHNMTADSADSWSYGGPYAINVFNSGYAKLAPKFDVWVKAHSTDNLHRFLNLNLSGSILSAQLYNATELELATTSITPDNATKYQYRVVTNDSVELLPWTTPSVFRSNKFTSYAYLGKFDCRHQIITLIIAEKNNKSNGSVYIYNSDNIQPVKISHMFVQYHTGLSVKNASDWNKGFGILSAANDVERINLNIENTSKNELYHVYLKRESDGKDTVFPIGNNWEHNLGSPDPTTYISSSFFNKPGKYTIIIRPEIAADNNRPIIIGAEARAHFTVLPGPITLPLKTVEYIILIILTTGAYMFVVYRKSQKRKLAKEAQNKQIATLQLQSIRSQLNPHFIFNALAGIQNLMNKNAIEDANRYLTRFARLTRNVLDDGQKELTTIEHEAALLNDYLQMEQLRFSFKFNINTNDVDPQIEIPAMLLQPFVENAVKHGVSALKERGMISIDIIKNENNLTLSVADNGKGFSESKTDGMGIKLCEERIRLLNCIYKNINIVLHKKSDNGTQITIELNNWLQ